MLRATHRQPRTDRPMHLYWQGLYTGPIQAAAYFAQTWMLQALSGLDFAWGQLSIDELNPLYELHTPLMDLGSSLQRAQAVGSQQLAFLLLLLERHVTTRPHTWCAATPCTFPSVHC